MQTPQSLASQSLTNSPSMYDSNSYRDQYSTSTSSTTDPALTVQTQPYSSMAGTTSHPYNLSTSISAPLQSNNTYESQPYNPNTDDSGMPPTHVAALTAAASNSANNSTTHSSPTDPYTYPNPQSSHQPTYTTNGYPSHDWRQWTRTYAQMSQPGEYMNTATTLMTLGREGTSGPQQGQGPSGAVQGQSLVDPNGNGIQAQSLSGHIWPGIAFPGAANRGMGH